MKNLVKITLMGLFVLLSNITYSQESKKLSVLFVLNIT